MVSEKGVNALLKIEWLLLLKSPAQTYPPTTQRSAEIRVRAGLQTAGIELWCCSANSGFLMRQITTDGLKLF